VGFSRVEVRPNIFVSIFSEFCILLIFYFCVENDVQNPHVSVLKFISVKFLYAETPLSHMLKHHCEYMLKHSSVTDDETDAETQFCNRC
jgi:hypothetical protein